MPLSLQGNRAASSTFPSWAQFFLLRKSPWAELKKELSKDIQSLIGVQTLNKSRCTCSCSSEEKAVSLLLKEQKKPHGHYNKIQPWYSTPGAERVKLRALIKGPTVAAWQCWGLNPPWPSGQLPSCLTVGFTLSFGLNNSFKSIDYTWFCTDAICMSQDWR